MEEKKEYKKFNPDEVKPLTKEEVEATAGGLAIGVSCPICHATDVSYMPAGGGLVALCFHCGIMFSI